MTYNERKEENIKQKRERNKNLLHQIMGSELQAEEAAESGPPKGANCE
jgi:hypothetical protein